MVSANSPPEEKGPVTSLAPAKSQENGSLAGKSKEARPLSAEGQGTTSLSGEDQGAGPLSGEDQGVNFYAEVLNEAEKLDFETAAGDEGLDAEIALLRVKIKKILEKNPENLNSILPAADMLARLVKARYSMTKHEKKGLKEAIGNVLREVAIPLGITIINKKL